MSDKNHGKFCWYELLTTDVEGAKRFYTELVGYGLHSVPMEGMDYTMWTKPGAAQPVGGVFPLAPEAKAMGAPPHWLLYVSCASVDATVTHAQSLGAKVHVPPTDIPGFGRFAVMADPMGAVFAVYTSANANEDYPGVDESVGGISWHELMTDDIERALTFYGALFGWNKTGSMDMGPMGTYQEFGHGEKSYGGVMKRPEGMPVSAWLAYITVPNALATIEKTRSLGGQIHHGPQEVPGGGVIAVGSDPQGAAFAFYQAPTK